MLYTEECVSTNKMNKNTINIWHGMAECCIQRYVCVLMYKISLTYGM